MSEPTWQFLPFHFKQDVVQNLDFKSRRQLRSCSKDDKSLVDNCPVAISKVALFISRQQISLYYTTSTDTCKKSFHNDSIYSIDDLLDDFVRQLTHPKTTVEELTIEFAYVESSKLLLEKIEKKLPKFRINAKKLLWYACFENPYAVKFVNYLIPKVLKSIRIGNLLDVLENINDFWNSPQWKNAEELEAFAHQSVIIDIEKFFHARKFKVRIWRDRFDKEKVERVIEKFIELDHPVGSYFSIMTENRNHLVENGEIEANERERNRFEDSRKYYKLATGNNYLLVERTIGGVRGLVLDNNDPIDYFII